MKRIISFCLVLVLIFGILSQMTIITLASSKKGTCGKKLKWEFEEWHNELIISGDGAMEDYSVMEPAPWYYDLHGSGFASSISNIRVYAGATSIGGCAFMNLDAVKKVTLPETITRIEIYAFGYCSNLCSLVLPNALEYIGNSAFANCTALQKIAIPKNVISIDYRAFDGCSDLRDITIWNPECVISDDKYTLNNPAKTTIYGYKGSTAQDYAEKYGYQFEAIGASEPGSKVELSAENIQDIVNIYARDMNTWAYRPEFMPDGYRYGFWDLDGDGILELFLSITDGTGIISENHFYKIDLNSQKVVEVQVEKNENLIYSDPELSSSMEIYQARDTGKIYYLCENYDRAGAGNGCLEMYFLTYNGNNIITIPLWGQTVTPESVSYQICTNNQWIDVSESTWQQHQKDILSNYAKISGEITTESGKKIDECQGQEVCKILSDLYNSFKNSVKFGTIKDDQYSNNATEEKSEAKQLCAYTANVGMILSVGEEMKVHFGLFVDGKHSIDWQKPAFAVTDDDILSVTKCEKSDIGYCVTLLGKSAGTSSVTVTDGSSGTNVTISISVRATGVLPVSYIIDDVPSYKPELPLARDVQTNVFDCYGLYVNDFPEPHEIQKINGEYILEFNVYNENYMYGAIDVYNQAGDWIRSYPIEKQTGIQGMYDTIEGAVYLVRDVVTLNALNYTSDSISAHTRAKVVVPEGGYFTISNNYYQSPGVFVYNSIDITMTAINSAMDLSMDQIDEVFDEVMGAIQVDNRFYHIFLREFGTLTQDAFGKVAYENYGTFAEGCSEYFLRFMEEADLDFFALLKISTNMAEDVYMELSPEFVKIALKTIFGVGKVVDYASQMIQISDSVHQPYIYMHTPEVSGGISIDGITVIPGENTLPNKAVLQVFRISDTEEMIVSDSGLIVDQYELYNICYVVGNEEVQPNGKVTIKIPIPKSFDKKCCTVYHQQVDGNWEMINGTVEGDFIVVEVEHFSLFAIAQMNTDVNMTQVERGDMTRIFWIGGSVLVIITAAAIVLAVKKKRGSCR